MPKLTLDLRRSGLTIEAGDETYLARDLEGQLADAVDNADTGALELLSGIILNGIIRRSDGTTLTEDRARHIRAQLLDPRLHAEAREERQLGWALLGDEEPDYLIEGVQLRGTLAQLAAPVKAGKSTLRCELTAALVNPNRPFLGAFPVNATDEERERGVVVISTEGNAEVDERAMLDAVGDDHASRVFMYHLAAEPGGVASADFTDEANASYWAEVFRGAPDPATGEFTPPLYVVLDNQTAIGRALGRSWEFNASNIAAFARIARSAGVENLLVITHSGVNGGDTLGGSEASAEADVLMSINLSSPTKISTKRTFSTRARMGGTGVPPTRLLLSEDGRLTLAETPKAQESPEVENTREKPDYEALVLAFVAEHHATSGSWPSSTELRAVRGSKPATRAARDALVASGRLVELPRSGRGGGSVYGLPEVTS